MARATNMKNAAEQALAYAKRPAAASIQTGEAQDPRLEAAQKELGFILARYYDQNPQLNRRSARQLQHMVDEFQTRMHQAGVDFPKMKCVYFPAMNHVAVWPEVMDHKELQMRLHRFMVHRQRHGLFIDAEDLAMGVRRAFPDYSPSRNLIIPPNINQQETLQ